MSLAAVLLGGCKTTHTVYVDAGVPLGKACPNGDECYNGAVCAEGECTLPCAAPGDCQAGFACRPLAERQNELTCLKVTYVAATAVGKNCAVDDTVCGEGEYCYKRIAADPDAYCSRDCADDRDCPATTYCQHVLAEEGGTDDGCGRMEKKVCVKKTFCAPCLFDSDCDLPGGGLCVADANGDKFCTTTCIPPTWTWDPNINTCPQPHAECKDRGDGVNVCMHRYGSCVGDGSLCAPCRTRHDCAGTALCYGNTYSKEKFCTGTCGADDPCPDTQSFTCLTFQDDGTTPAACLTQCLNYSPGFDPADTDTYPHNPKYPTCWPAAAGVP